MIALALSLGYALVALALLRPVTGHFAWLFYMRSSEYRRREVRCESCYRHVDRETSCRPGPDGDQWFGSFVLAVALVTLWPLTFAWVLADRKLPKVGAEHKAEVIEMRAKLKRLEAEYDEEERRRRRVG